MGQSLTVYQAHSFPFIHKPAGQFAFKIRYNNPGATCEIITPYGNEAAAQMLHHVLQAGKNRT
jgi:hypothetical protein